MTRPRNTTHGLPDGGRSSLRERSARKLVRWVSECMDLSYAAYTRDDSRASDFYARVFRWRQRIAFPIARRLDYEAMGDEMANQGWWG